MFSERYKNYNENIKPSNELIERTLKAAKAESKNNISSLKKKPRKLLIAAVILIFCIILAVSPVVAAPIDPLYWIMYQISPSTAQFFKPVQKSCVSNGIEMTVVSSYIHGDTAEIYISLRDLEGDRIDITTDLFDSGSINTPFDSTSHCDFSSFDKETKTATFLITISNWNEESIVGDKITFYLRQIVSNKKYYNGISVPVDLENIECNPKTQKVMNIGAHTEKEVTALVPKAPDKNFNIDGVDLTGAAYLDDELHIQTAITNSLEKDNHGSFYLKNGTEKVSASREYRFKNTDSSGNEISYSEYIFYIPQDKIGEYKLFAHFVTSDSAVSGNWSVTFPIENMGETEPETAEPTENYTEELQNQTENGEYYFPVKTLNPKTKEEYLFKILNSVDYYNTVSGKLKTNILNGYDALIEYSVDMTENRAYEHTTIGDSYDSEIFVENGFVFEYDNKNGNDIHPVRAYSKSDETADYDISHPREFNHYRMNPTNIQYASTVSIFPQEFAYSFLYDTSLWEISGTTKYLGRECAVIDGKINSEKYTYNSDCTSFRIHIDRESGIILKYEGFDKSGEVKDYTETEKISFEKPKIKSLE